MYVELLQEWYKREKDAGRVVYIKFFPGEGKASPEEIAEVAYKILTGEIKSTPITAEEIDNMGG